MRAPVPAEAAADAADKDLPLREDTRLLGRLLGDVLREQTGVAGFERVEAIRQTAVRFRRAGPGDAPAVKAELAGLLNDLPIGVLMLEESAGDASHWLAFHNFYVITRYNRSRLYATAVWRLAEALRAARGPG